MDIRKSSSQESLFTFEEVFFSRTDLKGVIEAGNSVFQRVSEYPWENLLGRPHNIIRHPDMPKGVFHLFWETIKASHPIGAYVKNCSRTGKYYWVFALAIPIQNGYLSFRFKPSSPLLAIVSNEYENLKLQETSLKLSPKESQEKLLGDLQKLGFNSYQAFMIKALMQELQSRQVQLGKPSHAIFKPLEGLFNCGQKLEEIVRKIRAAYKISSLVPLNLEIMAVRAGENAGALGKISSMYQKISQEVEEEMVAFNEVTTQIVNRVQDIQYSVCALILQAEVVLFFSHETNAGPINITNEMQLLKDLKTSAFSKVIASLKLIEEDLHSFERKIDGLRNQSTSLEIVRLTGKIEVSRMDDSTFELKSLIDELSTFRESLVIALGKIEDLYVQLVDSVLEVRKEVQLLTSSSTPPTDIIC